MDSSLIQKHNFEVAKNKIQSLAHKVPSTVSLNQFPIDGSVFSWNNHNVTGKEANELLVSPLQTTLIAQNSRIKDLFNIADEVYKTFDYLDKEYIQGIVASVKSAEIASSQAKTASDKAISAFNEAKTAQADIKKTIEALKATVSALKSFKERVSTQLDSIQSLGNRVISNAKRIQSFENELSEINQASTNIVNFSNQISGIKHLNDIDILWENVKTYKLTVHSLREDIKFLMDYVNSIDSYSHISDIDVIWNDVECHKTDLANLHVQMDAFTSKVNGVMQKINDNIASLQHYRSVLESHVHLSDIDTIWEDVECHKTDLANLHVQMDAFASKLNSVTQKINGDIASLQHYRSVLESHAHLSDIDAIWEDVECHKTNLSEMHLQLDTFVSKVNDVTQKINGEIASLQHYRSVLESHAHLSDIDAIWEDVQCHKKEIYKFHEENYSLNSLILERTKYLEEKIQTLNDCYYTETQRLNKKIKKVYWIFGCVLIINVIYIVIKTLCFI